MADVSWRTTWPRAERRIAHEPEPTGAYGPESGSELVPWCACPPCAGKCMRVSMKDGHLPGGQCELHIPPVVF